MQVTEHPNTPMPLAALHSALDELSRRPPAFDVVAPDLTRPVWKAVNPRKRVGCELESGRFVVARAGHYLFMATAGDNVRLALTRNGDDVAEPLEAQPSLLVAALQLKPGDVIALRITLRRGSVADMTTPVRWRGARV